MPETGNRPVHNQHPQRAQRWLAAVFIGASIVAVGTGTMASPPPATGSSYGAAGTGLNGFGGSIAPSPTSLSWPATGPGDNGGPIAFVGAHFGPLWGLPTGDNNSLGVGYCTMEDVVGSGTVSLQSDPPAWDPSEMARAGALMSTFGGDRVVPYGIDDSAAYDVASGEWQLPQLLGGGTYTRRRQIAVNFGVRMFLEDLSANALPGGHKLARDTAVVDGSGGDFAALRNGYQVAQYMADVADIQSAIGGIGLTIEWGTADGRPPTTPGTYPLTVTVADSTGRRVGMVPVLQLSDVGIGPNRSIGAVARVDNSLDSSDDMARWNAATTTGWPVWGMVGLLTTDSRFAVGPVGSGANMLAADVADRSGVARFAVTITSPRWELAFHAQAPTNDVALYSGTGVQGQATWTGPPQSASVRAEFVPPDIGRFQIRKALDDAVVQGARDMSGFTFEVARPSGEVVGSFTTDAAGRTPPVDVLAGDYRVTEIGRPPWAAVLIDAGPITFHLDGGPDPGALPVVEFVYTNRVPGASIATAAADASDGDRFVTIYGDGATVVDTVTYCGLVPGTDYRALGTIQVDAAGAASPAGVEGSTTFVPTEPCGSASVTLEIAADSALRGKVGVVFETLVLAATGQIVAQHADVMSAAQTISFPEVTTVLQPTDDADRSVADAVSVAGLAPGFTYRAELTLHERLDDGTCVATDMRAVAEPPAGTWSDVVVGPVSVKAPGLYVGFERIYLVGDAGADGTPEFTLVAKHEDCDAVNQTVRILPPPPPAPPPPPPTTTSTTAPTPPPTPPPPATTMPPPPPSPPSVMPTTTSTTTAPPPRPLPRTGSDTRSIAATAALLAACGFGALTISRRRW